MRKLRFDLVRLLKEEIPVMLARLGARSIKKASSTIKAEKAVLTAEGTKSPGSSKNEVLRTYPDVSAKQKNAGNMNYIIEEDGVIKIGALTRIDAIANSELIRKKAACLATAALRTSSSTVHGMATIGGTICQTHRCKYYQNPKKRCKCFRKGGDTCPAMTGNDRYHSLFEAEGGCIAINSQDGAPALIALNATIKTNKRVIGAEDFFSVNDTRSALLEGGEVVTEIQVPTARKSVYQKYALQKTVDFAIVSCAAAVTNEGLRIVLGGLYPSPTRVKSAEAAVSNGIDQASAVQAAEAAVDKVKPTIKNPYKIKLAKALVRQTLLEVG